jgi:hypothetical protein
MLDLETLDTGPRSRALRRSESSLFLSTTLKRRCVESRSIFPLSRKLRLVGPSASRQSYGGWSKDERLAKLVESDGNDMEVLLRSSARSTASFQT